jgi:hypothetical protein
MQPSTPYLVLSAHPGPVGVSKEESAGSIKTKPATVSCLAATRALIFAPRLHGNERKHFLERQQWLDTFLTTCG